MGPWWKIAAGVLWAVGCLGMDGAGSGSAAASSGSAALSPPGRAAFGSIHGHAVPDQQEMDDEVLSCQMEWCTRHP